MANDIGRQQRANSALVADSGHVDAARMNFVAQQGWRNLAEANRMVLGLIRDTARSQQELAFAMAQNALSAMPGAAWQAGYPWSRAAAAYGRACGHGLEAMWILAGAVRTGRTPQA